MALSSVHDVANPKHATNGNVQTDGCGDVDNSEADKVRIPFWFLVLRFDVTE